MRRGFTLIEMLVATAMAAVLVMLASQVFSTAIKARERIDRRSGEVSALQRAYTTISRDMHSAVVPPDDSGLQFGLTGGSPAALGANILQFASVVGEPLLAGRAANETVLVQYAIAPDPQTDEPTLWRYETPYPVTDGSAPGSSADTRATPLLRGVTAASYLFYSTDQQNWIESWDGETALPTAIRIDLQFGSADRTSGSSEDVPTETWTFALPAAKFAADQAAEDAAAADAAANGTTDTTGTTGGTGQGGAQ